MPYETVKQAASKRSLIEFAGILRRNGCGHKENVYLCRVCGEELADQIMALGEMMIKQRDLAAVLEKLRVDVPLFMFRNDD